MCGHVGIVGDLNASHEKIFRTLLILDSLRGEDSTGALFVSKFTGIPTIAKQLGDPFNLFNDGKFAKGNQPINKVFLGHNRFATSGGVNKAGAHPFEFDTIIGAHNGTLADRYRLDDDRDFKVDSQSLYHNIEKNGLKETIRRLGGKGNAWSLVWWDKIDHSINFLRNEERTMYMCSSEDGKALFWASEYWMLDVALARHGVKRMDIVSTAEHQHLAITVANNTGALGKPKVVEVKPDPVIHVVRQNPFPVQQHQKPPHVNLTPVNTTELNKRSTQTNVVVTTTQNPPAVGQAKKFETVGKPNGLASNPSYINTGTVRTLEILTEKKDKAGGRYLTLFDAKEPYVDIRLYPCKQDAVLFDMLGEDIHCQITELCDPDETSLRAFYKVSPWTVKFNAPVKSDEAVLAVDHTGRLIDARDWLKKYNACSWCNSDLNIEANNRFTREGDCICETCSKDPVIRDVVTLL